MIAGLGADIVNIQRIEKTLARFGAHFTAKFFTDAERRDIEAAASDRLKACKAAKYFAAKEAAAKALGIGFRNGIAWREIAVSHDEYGAPRLDLSGKARAHAADLCAPAETKTLLSLSDDYPFAQAVVIIEKI